MATSYTRVESVRKACEILEVIADAKEPITGQEVAIRAHMQPGTVMSQLSTLQDKGFVQETGGGWRLGMKLALFWARVRSGKESERDRIERDIEALGD